MRIRSGIFIFVTMCLSQTVLGGPIGSPVLKQAASDTTGAITSTDDGWTIKTRQGSYQISLDKSGKVKQVYYGDISASGQGREYLPNTEDIDEVPVRGGAATKNPIVELVFSDHVRDVELSYVRSDILQVEGRPTLKIVEKDKYYPLQITSYIRVLPEYDIIEKWLDVQNTGKKGDINIENLLSGSIVLPAGDYLLNHMSGSWANEFQPAQTRLTTGTKTLYSRDFKSADMPSWYTVTPTQNTSAANGPAWFGTLQYSGNWKIEFERYFAGHVQITAGINFWDTEWNLKPDEIFTTPKFISGYCNDGIEGGTQRLQQYIKNDVLPVNHRNKLRPVLYNSWYATEFDVNETQQLELASSAKALGAEMFVVDDGWFKGRIKDNAGLGDWEPDKSKFPNGLQPMIAKINAIGLDFGIWIEPEMVNPNSDLYRKHPEWAFNFPHRTATQQRNQLVLNLAREDVYQYLFTSLSKLLAENNIKYVKWDHNRALTEPGWPDAPPGQERGARIGYIRNLYRLIRNLRDKFPDVWFENCSSGGGRPDIGMLLLMDMTWVSDNTDPLDRLLIQYGYLNEFPPKTMIAWVTQESFHQPDIPLAFKFDVSMSGVLGIGYDIRKWSAAESLIAKQKIELYKQIRPIVQNGSVHRLLSPNETNRCALIYTDATADSALLFVYNLGENLGDANPEHGFLKFVGLDKSKHYLIPGFGSQSAESASLLSGAYLMDIGIQWPLKGSYKSLVFLINSVK